MFFLFFAIKPWIRFQEAKKAQAAATEMVYFKFYLIQAFIWIIFKNRKRMKKMQLEKEEATRRSGFRSKLKNTHSTEYHDLVKRIDRERKEKNMQKESDLERCVDMVIICLFLSVVFCFVFCMCQSDWNSETKTCFGN